MERRENEGRVRVIAWEEVEVEKGEGVRTGKTCLLTLLYKTARFMITGIDSDLWIGLDE